MQNIVSAQIAYGERSDELLIQQARIGDQQAFEMLVHRYQAPLLRCIQRIVRDKQMAEDISQQVFLQLFLSLAMLRGAALKYWLFRVAHYRCLDELRRKRPCSFTTLEAEANEEQIAAMTALLDPDPLPEEVAMQHELQQQFRRIIQALPPSLRSVVQLRHYSQMPFAEISRNIGIPENTAKTHYHRAKLLLRTKIARDIWLDD